MGDESYYTDKVADYMADTILTPEEREFNQTIFYGADVTIETVINAAKRFPMMSEHQLIIVKEAQNLKIWRNYLTICRSLKNQPYWCFATKMVVWIEERR